MRIAFLAMVVLTCGWTATCLAAGRSFHVDAESGDDGRTGDSPQAAWRSLERVNRASLLPGDRVLLRRGQTWRGQLVPQSGDGSGAITYGAYGEGAKPTLLGSIAMDRETDWIPAGEGVWATAPMRFESSGVHFDLQKAKWRIHQEGGAACTLSVAAEGELQIACKSNGTSANHIQLVAGRLRVKEGEYYLLKFRARCTQPFVPGRVTIMKEVAPFGAYVAGESGMPQIGTEWAEHAIRFQGTKTADDARVTFYLGKSLPAGATLLLQPLTIERGQSNQPRPLSVDVGNIVFNHGEMTGFKKWRVEDLKEEGDYFYDRQTWQVKLRCGANPAKRWKSIELAMNRHIVSQGGKGHITYENLALAYGAAHGIGGGGTHDIIVRDCDVSWIGGGHQFTRPDGKPVRFGNGIEFWSTARNCLVEGCRIWEVYDAALTNQGSGTNVQENITYRRNVIWNCEYSFEYWNRENQSLTRNIRFEHNTCVSAGRGWGNRQRPDKNGRHLMFYNNSARTEGVVVRYNIFADATDSLMRLHGRDWTAELALDGNCWFQGTGPLVLWGTEKIDAAAFGAFMKERKWDAGTVAADPKFVDATKNDYRVAPDSPARKIMDAGLPAGALP